MKNDAQSLGSRMKSPSLRSSHKFVSSTVVFCFFFEFFLGNFFFIINFFFVVDTSVVVVVVVRLVVVVCFEIVLGLLVDISTFFKV